MGSIGDNIKRVRMAAGLTQEEFGKIAGVSNMAVSQWENGRAVPRMGAVQAIADHLGINKSEIIDEAPRPGSPQPFPRRPARPVESRTVPRRRLGYAHAGAPDEPFADDGVVEVPESVVARHPNLFVVGINGECMNRVVANGTDAGVDPDMEPANGAVALVLVAGEVVVRRFFRGSSSVMLVSDSTEQHPDIILGPDDDFEVQGVVVWAQRDLERA